jgi:hypothetical protein
MTFDHLKAAARVEAMLTGPHIVLSYNIRAQAFSTYCGRKLPLKSNHIENFPEDIKCAECLQLWQAR